MHRSGKVPVRALRIYYDKASSGLILCRSHPSGEANGVHHHEAFRRRIDVERYEPEQVLQSIHDSLFGTNGHFTARDPVSVITAAGSLFSIKAGTTAAARDCADPCLRGPHAVLDKDVVDFETLQSRTGISIDVADDVLFRDWPIEYMMQSGYTLWCVPRKVHEWETYQMRVRARGVTLEYFHSCEEVVEFDRQAHVWLGMDKEGLSEAEAETEADLYAFSPFKVAVELDLSWFRMPNMLLFLPPEAAKDPAKVVEEMKLMVGYKETSPSCRLVPHPRFAACPSTNWFKVVPRDEQVSWEAPDYFRMNAQYQIFGTYSHLWA